MLSLFLCRSQERSEEFARGSSEKDERRGGGGDDGPSGMQPEGEIEVVLRCTLYVIIQTTFFKELSTWVKEQ